MKSIVLPSYNKNVLRSILSLKIDEKEVPEPGHDEVLVKTHAAGCNPSDIAFIQGGYNIVKSLPAVPGFEGSGTIVSTGKNMETLIGKKVSCFIQDDKDGTWAEYFVGNKNNIILVDDNMDMDQAACFSVNPFTAYALIEIAILRGSKAIIQNASGGQVPAFIRKLAQVNNIEVINIVRKQETADQLISDGYKYVLVEQDENYSEKLIDLANELDATTAFDAVGGPGAGTIFNSMPDDSELVVYGGLSNKKITDLDTMDIIFRNKFISGFNLLDWKDEMGEEDFVDISFKLQQLFIEGKLKTNFQDVVTLENIVPGLKSYLGNMSKGKILIKP